MLAAVQAAIREQHLFPNSGTIVVGVSGGPDSVCLLHLLIILCKSEDPYAGIRLHVAHLDHGLRGEAGHADAVFVADLARQWGVPCTLGEADVPALARQSRRSLEEVARQARYTFLHQVAASVGAERIAVAHHADDQVETLVMHWLRGSGLAGLAGMRALEGDIIRPLLGVSRAEILRYCEQHQLPYREDASNQDRRFLRNRIRHDLLPVLAQYNPNLRETLLRNAAVLAEEDAYIQAQVDACWPAVILRVQEEQVEGDVRAYQKQPVTLRHHLLLRVASQVSGGETHLERRHVEACDALLLRAAGSGSLHLPGKLRLRRVYGWFALEHQPAERSPAEAAGGQNQRAEAVPLPTPGTAQLAGSRWLVRGQVLEGQHHLPPGYEHGGLGGRWGYMDLDAVKAYQPLHVRTRRAGDRFRTLGMQQEKKLQDVLVNAKIARDVRDTLPLVCGADDRILWVAGYQVADLVKLTPTTRRVLALELVDVSS
jgi:tRNA(Ile)-lysidine synthase